MTIDEAYRRLRISDQSVGDDVVIAHFVSYVYALVNGSDVKISRPMSLPSEISLPKLFK